jgi:hypothetical protein
MQDTRGNIFTSVPDPHRFKCGSGSRSRDFEDQKLKRIYSWNIFFFDKKLRFISIGLHKGRPGYRRSLQPTKENIQHFKTLNFFTFSIFWVIFASHESGSGFSQPKSMRIQEDLDPILLRIRIRSHGSESGAADPCHFAY